MLAGGAALSIKEITGVPIKFVGVGEKLNVLEPFRPESMASRILGQGDLMGLVEKVGQIQSESAKNKSRSSRRNSKRGTSLSTTSAYSSPKSKKWA